MLSPQNATKDPQPEDSEQDHADDTPASAVVRANGFGNESTNRCQNEQNPKQNFEDHGSVYTTEPNFDMRTIPDGYQQRKDGNWQKTVHFGKKGTAAETLIRNSRGDLITVFEGQLKPDQPYSPQVQPVEPVRRQLA